MELKVTSPTTMGTFVDRYGYYLEVDCSQDKAEIRRISYSGESTQKKTLSFIHPTTPLEGR